MALVSITVRTFEVGLTPVLEEVLQRYVDLIHPPMALLLGWTEWIWPSWRIPGWLKDLYALSFIGAAANVRAIVWPEFREVIRKDLDFGLYEVADHKKELRKILFLKILALVLVGVSFLGIFALLATAVIALTVVYDLFRPIYLPETRVRWRGAVLTIVGGVGGLAMFLLVNEVT